jgi:hypothetical protein
MMPGDPAYLWHATSGEPLPALGIIGRLLNLLVVFVDRFRRHRGDEAPDPAYHGHLRRRLNLMGKGRLRYRPRTSWVGEPAPTRLKDPFVVGKGSPRSKGGVFASGLASRYGLDRDELLLTTVVLPIAAQSRNCLRIAANPPQIGRLLTSSLGTHEPEMAPMGREMFPPGSLGR